MPTPIYRASLDFLNVVATPTPDPSITFPLVGHPALTVAMGLVVRDGMGNEWLALGSLGVGDNGSGVAEFQAGYVLVSRATLPPFFVDTDDPLTWRSGGVSVNDAPGHGGSGLLAGGTLSIEKDFDNNRITLITPIGSMFEGLDRADSIRAHTALNNTPLITMGIAFQYVLSDTFAVPNTIVFDYRNLDLYQDGLLTSAIPMTLAYPGGWQVALQYLFDFTLFGEAFVGGVGHLPALPVFSSQEIAWYEIRADVPVPAGVDTLNAWRRRGNFNPEAGQTDMDASAEHGIVWRAGPDSPSGPAMLAQRTFNNAGSWETWTVFSDPTNSNNSPSVTWYNQRLYVTWHNGTDIVQARSLDGGVNWDVPTVIPFIGTNPRRIVDRTGGGAFLFYFDTTNHLKVVITYDGGGSYLGPYVVASSVVAQQIDAEFVPDGSIVASIFIAGVWTQFRSRDLGVHWV